jgi:hypothetical protein
MLCDAAGRGAINVLAADQLMLRPKLYATFLLWLLSELFETLPEAGDLAQAETRLLLRRGASAVRRLAPALVEKIEQVVRLIRSKGVGVYLRARRTRSTFRNRCWASSATGCSTRCAPSRPRTRSGARGGRDLPPNPKLNTDGHDHRCWASARRWSPASTRRACRCRCSAA